MRRRPPRRRAPCLPRPSPRRCASAPGRCVRISNAPGRARPAPSSPIRRCARWAGTSRRAPVLRCPAPARRRRRTPRRASPGPCAPAPPRRWRPPSAHGSFWSCFSPSEIFPVASSTRSTLTVISSPGDDDRAGRGHARPAHLRDVEQALDAAAQVDEGAEVERPRPPGRSAPRRARSTCALPRRWPAAPLRAPPPRHDHVLAAVLVLDDAEGVDLALVHRRVGGADDVDLRQRAERALAGDAHLVAALDRLLDPALHRQARLGTRPRARAGWRRCARPCARAPCRRWSRRPWPGSGRRPSTSMSPSSSFSSATSISASPLPPTLTKATFGPIATMVPSMVWPRSNCFAWMDAANIAAKSSSGSLNFVSPLIVDRPACRGRAVPWNRHRPRLSRGRVSRVIRLQGRWRHAPM